MDSILLASNTSTTLSMLSSLFQFQQFEKVCTAASGSECRRMLLENDFDLLIIDSPLPDEFGTDLALHAADNSDTGIILLCPSEKFYDVCPQVEDAGVFTISKPAGPDFLYQSVRLLTAARKRVMNLQHENVKLQNKIEEMRLVDRAKCILIQYLNMTEKQAHKYIEKQAMDFRQSRSTIAKKILQTYEM